jgi:hypothetical protein
MRARLFNQMDCIFDNNNIGKQEMIHTLCGCTNKEWISHSFNSTIKADLLAQYGIGKKLLYQKLHSPTCNCWQVCRIFMELPDCQQAQRTIATSALRINANFTLSLPA